jgi:aryl-alcohol dehydrogenase (NADP+)
MQDHYNLVYREEEREMIPLCRAEGIGLLPWSPLARGFLTGSRKRGGGGETLRANTDDFAARLYFQETDFQIVDRVIDLAQAKGVQPAQIALAWVLHQPGVTAPIFGVRTLAHLEEAVAALAVDLNQDELKALEEPYQPHPVLGHD